MKTLLLCAAAGGFLTAVAQAQNANVSWQTPTAVSGASDVSTLGIYFGSWAPQDGNANSMPVNGVTFQGFSDIPGLSSSGFDNGFNGYANPNTGNGNYNSLLQIATYDDTGNGANDTISWNDVPGHTYLIEIWANDGRGLQRSETITGGANTSGALNFGMTPTYIIGTYVADSSGSQTITFNGFGSQGDFPQINLLLIRDITPANITWQAPVTISGPSDVKTNGTTFGTWAPFNGAAASGGLVVNGVNFNAFSTLPNATDTFDNCGGNGTYASPNTSDANYNNLLTAAAFGNTGNPYSISWSGMTAGHTYLVQFWVNDGRNSTVNARTETVTGGANTSASLAYGSGNSGPGQYIVGTFVATGSGTETLTLTPGPSIPSAQFNLLQVRDVTPPPAFTNYQTAVLSDLPVGYWPLNFDLDTNTDGGGNFIATDLSGNTNNGTYFNSNPSNNRAAGPTSFITNSVSFSSSEVDLSTGSNIAVLNFTGPTTLEAWAQPTALASDLNTLGDIIAKGYDSGNFQEIALRQNAGSGPNFFGYFGTSGVNAGQQSTNWVHLVIANDGHQDSFYINGVLAGTAGDTTGSILFADAITWAIGNGTSGGNGRTFNGNICQVAMYNYGLTSTQVLNHFFEAEVNASPAVSRPIIVSQPQPQSSYPGGQATFSVTAVSTLNLTNQWFKNGSPLVGQTGTSLTITGVSSNDAANYSVIVGNSNGTTNSISASLTVLTPGSPLEWSAIGNNGVWDVASTPNWINQTNSVQTVFNQGDQVLFDDTAGVPTSVTVNGMVQPSAITVNSSANSFNISSGAISGSGSLTKSGSSLLTITSGGGFNGTATINGGAVYAGNNSFSSVASISIANNATLDLAGGTIGGNRPVTVSGTGLNGEGAIINSFSDFPQEQLNISLTGDSKFAGSSRWDLASGSQITGPHAVTLDMSAAFGDNYFSQWNSVILGANVSGVVVTNGSGIATNKSVLGFSGMDTSCQNPGTVFTVAQNGQIVFFNGGFNGSIHVLNGGDVQLLPANVALTGTSLTLDGGSTWETFFNSGTNLVSSAVTLNGVAHFLVGDHYIVYSNIVSGPGGFVMDFYNHAAVFTASNTYSGPTVIGSSGNSPEVALIGNGSISHSSSIFFGGGDSTVPHIDASLRNDQTFTVASGQTLGGIGAVTGNLSASSGAIIAPAGTNTTIGITTGANPVGAISASGNVALGGTTVLKLDGSGSNDMVQAGGSITYAGTLSLVNISGAPLVAGDTFHLFSATTFSGTFTGGITPATPGPGLAWDTTQLNAGTINVITAQAQPIISHSQVSGTNFIFSGTNGAAGSNYVVLTTTNIATPLTNWTPVLTNSFDINGGFHVTNPINPAVSRSFYLLKDQ